ncbi:MAG: hypothetical protein HY791_38695 [Deltaproteobacteria bacterium]|nr:hypothetical protein [Deltaproteobacteria bacterium]
MAKAPALRPAVVLSGLAIGLAVGGVVVWARAERGPVAVARSPMSQPTIEARRHIDAATRAVREGRIDDAESELESCIERFDSIECHRLAAALLALEGRVGAAHHLAKVAASSTIAEEKVAIEALLKARARP